MAIVYNSPPPSSPQWLMSSQIDFAATSTGNVVVPSISGYYAAVVQQTLWLDSIAGSLSTSPTIQIGNNGSVNNVAASQTPNLATIFAAGAPSRVSLNPGAEVATQKVALTTAITCSVTVGATGTGLTLLGRIMVEVAYIPV